MHVLPPVQVCHLLQFFDLVSKQTCLSSPAAHVYIITKVMFSPVQVQLIGFIVIVVPCRILLGSRLFEFIYPCSPFMKYPDEASIKLLHAFHRAHVEGALIRPFQTNSFYIIINFQNLYTYYYFNLLNCDVMQSNVIHHVRFQHELVIVTPTPRHELLFTLNLLLNKVILF